MGPRFESVKVHQWPVGQVVKTEASHAFNIGSNPVRVTKLKSEAFQFTYYLFTIHSYLRGGEEKNKQSQPKGFDIRRGKPLNRRKARSALT